jgi:4-amino-4-deoxy-L-arabinose transferase-like glycosyltransferase
MAEGRRLRLEALALAALWALLYMPYLGTAPLDHEEGRRFLPAREMLASGDFVLPTLYGRPYLAKPPLHYWEICAASLPAGAVSAWTTRLPSALSVLLLAWLVHALAARHLGRGAAPFAAALWLLMPLALQKGTLGELDAPLSLFVGLALAGQFAAARGRPWAAVAGGIALALAVLTKGPAAWVFTGAAAVGSAVLEPRRARAHLWPALAGMALSALLAGIWVFLLAQRIGWDGLRAAWGGELQGGTRTLLQRAVQKLLYVQRAWCAVVPASALVLALVPRAARRAGLPDLVRFALALSALSALFFLVYPRTQARYLTPAAPWLALAGAYVLQRGLAAARGESTERMLALACNLAGISGALAGVALLADRLLLHLAPFRLDALGCALALALIGAGAWALRAWRRGARAGALLASFAVLAFARGVHTTQIVAQSGLADGSAQRRAALAAALPGDGPVFTAHWAEFNLLAPFPRPLRYTGAPARDVPPNATFLYSRASPGFDLGEVTGWQPLGAFPLSKGDELVALRRPAP